MESYASNTVLAAAISAGTAILFACLGEILCERAGVLNLGVEGMMLMGALGGFAHASGRATPGLGRWRRWRSGGLLSLIHALLTVTLRANQVVSGLALTLFGGGLRRSWGSRWWASPPARCSTRRLCRCWPTSR